MGAWFAHTKKVAKAGWVTGKSKEFRRYRMED